MEAPGDADSGEHLFHNRFLAFDKNFPNPHAYIVRGTATFVPPPFFGVYQEIKSFAHLVNDGQKQLFKGGAAMSDVRFTGRKAKKRNDRVTFRVTPEERRKLLAQAIERGLTVSEHVREVLKNAGVLGD